LWIPLDEYLATMLRDPGLRQGLRQAALQWIHDLVRELDAARTRYSAEIARGCAFAHRLWGRLRIEHAPGEKP
ncbi:MAG TPA: hypothetical protein VFX38_07540, partial [Gammaproteobacteria bacterium]|nr:hypothetical protein [Gammaproteobacteria bacterium]